MIKVLIEEMKKKSLKKSIKTQILGGNKTLQDLEVETEPIKKTQTEGTLEKKTFRNSTGTQRKTYHKMQEVEQKMSGIKDTIEETAISIKKKLNLKKFF